MTTTQLDLFSHPTFQNELFGFEYNTIRPYNKLDEGPIEFNIVNNKEYINLAETILHLKVKVTNADGGIIATAQDKDDVALINNSMHSIFSDVTIFINVRTTFFYYYYDRNLNGKMKFFFSFFFQKDIQNCISLSE